MLFAYRFVSLVKTSKLPRKILRLLQWLIQFYTVTFMATDSCVRRFVIVLETI
jgi:hypothetical protein